MHGTYVEDTRIPSHDRHRLYDNDVVKFGNEVTRGPGTCLVNDESPPFYCYQPIRWLPLGNELVRGRRSNIMEIPDSFPPLHVVVRYSWVDDRYVLRIDSPRLDTDAMTSSFGRPQDAPRMSQVEPPPNTFQVPDYDDEDEEDDEISFVQETVLKPKLEVVVPPATHGPQDSLQPYIENAVSGELGQEVESIHSNPHPPPPSFASSPLPQSLDNMARLYSSAVQSSMAASDPSALSDAQRQAHRQAHKRAMNLDENPTSSTGTSMSTNLESPAKSNSSAPTSSQSKESDDHSNVKLKLLINHQTSSQSTGLPKRAIIVDEDLTQSESDSDEAYSPDLMVDDSEDGQNHDVPTDYGSDSEEEALLMAENHDTSVASVAGDSTDSESSRSDFSDDIGMERDEDFFVDSANKTPGTKDPLPNNAFNESNGAPAEHEQVPYNMRPGNFTMQSTRLNLPSNPLNRAPSPSDAAMAKPCDFATGGAGVPGGLYPYTNQQSWSNSMTSAYNSAWPCALDGRNHGPYDDRFSGFQYPYGASYAPGQFTCDSFRSYPSQMSMLQDQGFNPDKSCTKPLDQSGRVEPAQPKLQPPPISISSGSGNAPPEAPQHLRNLPTPAAKVSIDSIVQKVSDEPLSPPNSTKLKRKADEMTNDAVAEPASDSPKQVTQVQDIQPLMCPPHSKIASLAQIEAIQNVSSANGSEQERPAKRARTGNETRKSSFAMLAATALAGAVVGGVGVVAALVSLPQDFFV
jgi:hypothetical protein